MNIKSTSTSQQHILETMSTNHIRVAVVGNVDAGKSTLIGTLTSSTLDDGKGSSRKEIAKLQHELETGRTSSISSHLMGFDQEGKVVTVKAKRYKEAVIVPRSTRVVSLMDLAGHEKYFKTTIKGLSQGMADYALVLVNASQPPTHMTMHHLNLCQSCGIPVIVVLTKVDSCPGDVFRNTKKCTSDVVRSSGKKPFAIKNQSDIETVKDKLHALVPVVETSCVTGEGLELLQKLLYALPRRRQHEKKICRPFEFLVEDTFNVTGVGIVFSGFVNAGEWKKGDPVYFGPLKDGTYIKTVPKSAHVAQTDVDHIYAGHAAAFAVSLTKAQRKLLNRRGMYALQEPVELSRSFSAEICLMKGDPITMTKGQTQTTMHILHLKRPVRLVDIEATDSRVPSSEPELVLRPGCRARVTFAFTQGPEYVRKGMRIILRDGHVRGVGIIRETHA